MAFRCVAQEDAKGLSQGGTMQGSTFSEHAT